MQGEASCLGTFQPRLHTPFYCVLWGHPPLRAPEGAPGQAQAGTKLYALVITLQWFPALLCLWSHLLFSFPSFCLSSLSYQLSSVCLSLGWQPPPQCPLLSARLEGRRGSLGVYV